MPEYYLKVGNAIFNDELYPQPSQIVPTVDLIKNAERALGGRMHVDIVANKESVRVVFDVLNETEFDAVMRAFNVKRQNPNETQELAVEYFDIYTKEIARRNLCVMDTSFDPLVIEDEIKWRNVIVDLEEI
ncbi:MAG: hypothetical protein FWC80_05410 [Firmicutes bacterium]|nr:hypothetical protein [Bacillota bacterium]